MDYKKMIEEFIINEVTQADNAPKKDLNISEDEPLITNNYLSSLSIVRLVVFLEENFQISLDDALEIQNFETLGRIFEMVGKKLETQQAS